MPTYPSAAGSSSGTISRGTAAARPAPGAVLAGTLYWATDTDEITLSDGAAWHSVRTVTIGANDFVINGNGLGFNGGNGPRIDGANAFNMILQGSKISLASRGGPSQFDLTSVGSGVQVAEGANAKQGVAVLVAGTVVVANTTVTANSRIFLTSNADGGAPGFVRVSARVVGTSFTILSSSGTDTSSVAWEIYEPG